ncbi:GLPGLI family protein [Belliella kenyensis]|uniref:GLPGLI family protein n=1 Tax=Belliella kenyensis TaxID=1472724 RepID=A0ABV8ELY7_9BACT|nr:GLPGLI family protein [Belliella kenyensis]MCH7403771.1 GLPGLI family protein [Belliella kenyensis]MDN3602445.1 GLPGLI family protein [Belliella kenyensis]
MRFILYILFFLYATAASCQNVVVTYSRVNNHEDQLDGLEERYGHLKSDIREEMTQLLSNDMKFKLQHAQGKSKFRMIESDEDVSQKEIEVGNNKIVVMRQKSKIDPHVFKNLVDKVSWSLRDVLGKGFIVSDSLNFEWAFHPESKLIGEYNCYRATTFYDDLEVEAWFAEEIPVFDGPDVFVGLPGLILELKTHKYNFKALEIEYVDEVFEFEKPSGFPEMNRSEFEKAFQERMENLYPAGAKIKKY